ncbi:MAG: site-2 protease family protein [Euryarchaeota archaeon]|nr:site-2 protease family protein [Euryarchaeota archaeon]
MTEENLIWSREKVEKGFSIYRAAEDKGALVYTVMPRYSHEESFSLVLEEFKATEYLPKYRRIKGELQVAIVRRKERRREIRPLLHFLLLIATVVTMTWAGYVWWAEGNLSHSIIFAVSLMSILGIHELGHALTARRKGIDATLPLFLPVPPPAFPFGTLGAVIFMNSPVPNRKSLLDVGAAGPIAGFLLCLPILTVGLAYSQVIPPSAVPKEGEILLGPSLLFLFLAKAILGDFTLIELHPLAIAGWAGLFVTSLNLLPMGQLDGGHVVRGLLPVHYRKAYYSIALLLIAVGMRFWLGWIFWVFIVSLLTRMEHPGPLDDVSELDLNRKILAFIVFLILVLSFMPVPIAYVLVNT